MSGEVVRDAVGPRQIEGGCTDLRNAGYPGAKGPGRVGISTTGEFSEAQELALKSGARLLVAVDVAPP